MARTIEQQLAEATNKLQRLKAKKKTRDTRLKIVVGATLIAEARNSPQFAALVVKALQARVTRPVDLKEVGPLLDELTRQSEGS